MAKKKILADNEKCLDCEKCISEDDDGHSGSPYEMYVMEGHHICDVKNPRVVVVKW